MGKNSAFEEDELEALLKEVNTPVVAKKTAEPSKEVSNTLNKVEDTKFEQAFGVVKNDIGKWDVVEILYNSKTNECRINDVLRTEASKAVAQARANEALSRVLNGLSIKNMKK